MVPLRFEFDWGTALPRFLLVAAGGVVVGWIVYRVVSFAGRRLEDTVLESVILLLTPFRCLSAGGSAARLRRARRCRRGHASPPLLAD